MGEHAVGYGVGIPGLVDAEQKVRIAPNLKGLEGVSLGALLSEHLGRPPAWAGNDATAAAWGEYRLGAGRGSSDMLMVTLGTGIGGGIVLGGRLVEGTNRFAGEFGHMTVDPEGPPCPCGRRGCWERYASGAGLGRLAREAAQAGQAPGLVALAGDPEAVRGEHVSAAAAAGDPEASQILWRFARWVALGLANLVCAFDPDTVVLGGGLVGAGERLLGATRAHLADLLSTWPVPRAPVVALASLGPAAGAVGAALLASASAGGGSGR